jgi:hypothetical protein
MVSKAPDREHVCRTGNGLRLAFALDNLAHEHLLFFFVQLLLQSGKVDLVCCFWRFRDVADPSNTVC